MDGLSPDEKLKRLEQLIKEKEEKKKKLAEEEALTDEEIEQARAEAEQELQELRLDEEIQRLSARIRNLEAQGRTDETIIQELEKRGVPRSQILRAMTLHQADHADHNHNLEEIEESLEEKLGTTPRQEGNVFYALADRMNEGLTGQDILGADMYNTLQEMREQVSNRGYMTSNEEQALNQFAQTLEETQQHYQAAHERTYAAKENAVIQQIKEMTGVKIGNTYYREETDT